MKRERGIENRLIMMTADSGKKVKDIRDEVSLGYMDLQKKNNISLLDRIKRCVETTRDEIAAIKDSPEEV